ncbi:MAG: bifunctional folylpolyglutamate synthase/dihydrofolate synthase [Bacteroidetes bacterium]|nr:bifunctional folylpolyglutamate synthase/dihydrofolate synthase [Bacteroidota bacterium]
MTYPAALEYMYSQLPMFHRVGAAAYKPNLDNTYALLKLLNNPQQNFKCIHIAGTNGKGSVSHYLASVFQSAGYKTALYTSPHLKDFRERIKINGKMIDKQSVCDFIDQYKTEFEKIKPSFFEMTVGMAFQYFSDMQVDIAIIETGLGGRLDSTNVLSPEMCVITNIGFDHMEFLGNTMKKIAVEKAGIIKENTPVIIGETQEETTKIFIDKAKELNANIDFADQIYHTVSHQLIKLDDKPYLKIIYSKKDSNENIEVLSDLIGVYQLRNIKTVLTAAALLRSKGFKLSIEDILDGIKNVVKHTGLLGRWQILSENPLTICDTGHNESGIALVLEQINLTPHKSLHFVLGMVSDKEIDKVLQMLPQKAVYYFCKADIPRGMNQDDLKAKAMKHGLKGESFNSVKEALIAAQSKAKKNDLVFVGGSTFTVAEVV